MFRAGSSEVCNLNFQQAWLCLSRVLAASGVWGRNGGNVTVESQSWPLPSSPFSPSISIPVSLTPVLNTNQLHASFTTIPDPPADPPRSGPSENQTEIAHRIREVALNPSPPGCAQLLVSIAQHPTLSQNKNLLRQVSDAAAVVAHSFTPPQVAYMFHFYAKINFPHAGFFESVVESILLTDDLSYFRLEDLQQILKSIVKLRRNAKEGDLSSGARKLHMGRQTYYLFPQEHAFVARLVREIASDAHLKRLENGDIVNLLLTMAYLGIQEPDALKRVTGEIECVSRPETFSCTELSNIMYAFAGMNCQDKFIVEIVMKELAKSDRGPQLTPQHVSMALCSLGKLNCKNVGRDVINALCERVAHPQCIKTMENVDIACIMYGLGLLDHFNETLMTLLCDEVVYLRRLDSLEGYHAVCILHGMARLRFRNTRVLEAIARHIAGRKIELSRPELCGVLYSWARLKYRDGLGLEVLADTLVNSDMSMALSEVEIGTVIYSLGSVRFWDERLTGTAENVWLSGDRLLKFNEKSLSMTLYGLAQLGCSDKRLLDRILIEITKSERLSRMENDSIATCISALSMLKLGKSGALETLANEVINVARRGTWSDRHLCNIMYSLGNVDYRGKQVITGVLEGITEPETLQRVTNQGISNTLYGLRLFKGAPMDLVHKLVLELTSMHRLKYIGEQDLCISIYSLGKMEFTDIKLFEQLLLFACEDSFLRTVSSIGVCQMIQAVCSMQYQNGAVVNKLVWEVRRRKTMNAIEQHDYCRLVKSLGWLKNEAAVDAVKLLVSPLLKESELKCLTLPSLVKMLRGICGLADQDRKPIVEVLLGEVKSRKLYKQNMLLSLNPNP